MKKLDMRRIVGIVLCVVLFLVIAFRFYSDYKTKNNEKQQNVVSESTQKFKEEYEGLNGTKNASDKDYLSVSIDTGISIVYKTADEISELMNSGSGVIYFGFNSCPWCRSMIETLVGAVNNNHVNNLYYVDVKDIRSSYEVKDKKLNMTKKGTDGYYKILDDLHEYLSDYKIVDKNKEYDTNEKRLYAPTVVVVKDGAIVGFHEGTVDSQEDPYLGLNDKEKEELLETFNQMIGKLQNTTCDNKTGC